jgi:hypothetical protein
VTPAYRNGELARASSPGRSVGSSAETAASCSPSAKQLSSSITGIGCAGAVRGFPRGTTSCAAPFSTRIVRA